MRIGLYCRELVGPNGINKSTIMAAAAMSGEGHEVEILSLRAASKAGLRRLFGAAASRLKIIEAEDRALPAKSAAYDLFINQFPGVYFPSLAPRSWLWFRAAPKTRPLHMEFYRPLGNSRFTVSELARRWGIAAGLLHPPIAVEDFVPLRKENIILSSGVLGGQARPKRELGMIGLFSRLHKDGKLPGWTYHVAGELEGGRPWLKRLERAAQGAPVRLHADAPLSVMKGLYGRARILWHACLCEHFGGALVEAMAAGCVVIAPDKGGPREIIRDGLDGRLYGAWSQLAAITLAVARRSGRTPALALRARLKSRRFGGEAFTRSLRRLLRQP